MDDQPLYNVCDRRGRVLGTFEVFDVAHSWAHEQAGEQGTDLPLTVEDRQARVSRRVWSGRCELVAWVEFAVLQGCDRPVMPAPTQGATGRR
jgi:hypothetical protein